MRLDRWRSLLDHGGHFATVSLDASRIEAAGQHELRLRWEAQAKALAAAGAPAAVVGALAELAQERTGRAGAAGRLLVAGSSPDGGDVKILLDTVLPVAPVREESLWGPVPQLMPAVRALLATPSYLLVKIDRAGADVALVDGLDGGGESVEITGEHDELHKVPGGGYSHLRYQNRVEDSVERNATEVANVVAKLQERHRPGLVLLSGAAEAVGAFLEHAPERLRTASVKLGTGGRAEGVSEEALDNAVTTALEEYRRSTARTVVERYVEAEGRQEFAVQGFDDVVDVIRRGQAEELLLHDDPRSTRHLWVGDGPLEIGRSRGDLASMGSQSALEVRADAALAWAVLASDGGITLLEDGSPQFEDSGLALPGGHPRLEDGIGALLRWSDRSTPREAVPSMPGRGEHRGGSALA